MVNANGRTFAFGRHDLARKHAQAPFPLQFGDLRTDLRRHAMAMRVPPGAKVPQEALLRGSRQTLPKLWRARTQAVDHVLPRFAARGGGFRVLAQREQRFAERERRRERVRRWRGGALQVRPWKLAAA